MQPLAEVFGFPVCNVNSEASRFRKHKLCPFNNKVPSCTKDKAKDPLGVCSVLVGDKPVITCPVRFREGWRIAEDAAEFFFDSKCNWTSLSEVSLSDKNGKTAGHIDLVLVSYDKMGRIIDFGSLEVQAVYISGNIRTPFEYFNENPSTRSEFDWQGQPNYPKPDFLSSSRKRLVPQILYKGGILSSWKKKQAIALQQSFFETLPDLPEVSREKAELAWLLYDLKFNAKSKTYKLVKTKTVYTQFGPAIDKIVIPQPGEVGLFVQQLQEKLDEKLEGHPPDNETLKDFGNH
jgi:hypothetical protein